MPKVSVVIPCYNAERFVGEAVDSVLAQTFTDLEVIVVDDGSTDNTGKVVAHFTDPRVHYVYQENQERSAARNAGIRLAQGQFIAFLDADDLWLPNKLAAQVRLMDSHPEVGVVYCATCKVRDGQVISVRGCTHRGNVAHALLTYDNIVEGTSAVMVRRECFHQVGVFNEDRALAGLEDWEMWLRLALRYPFDYVPQVLIKYRIHEGNTFANPDRFKRTIQCFFDELLNQPSFQTAVAPVRQQVKSLGALWYGRYCWYLGDMAEARQFFLEAARSCPWQYRAWGYVALSCLGPRWLPLLRASRARVDRLLTFCK